MDGLFYYRGQHNGRPIYTQTNGEPLAEGVPTIYYDGNKWFYQGEGQWIAEPGTEATPDLVSDWTPDGIEGGYPEVQKFPYRPESALPFNGQFLPI